VKYKLFFWSGLWVCVFMIALPASAQSDEEKLLEAEMQKSTARHHAITLQFDSAILLSHQGAYAAANTKYLFVLKNMRSIPTDFTYHFGLNSYYLAKYKQSVDWLTKYIQLKGTSGQYSEKAAEYLKKAEVELMKEQQAAAHKAGEVMSGDYDIDCGPSGKVTCPACNGTTVIVKKGYFSETYKTCPFCNKKGYLTCEEYNKIIRGELKPSSD
jgi:hypothetical protein